MTKERLTWGKKRSHSPIMTAMMVNITKEFLMKKPFTSSFVMFSTLFLASSDRDWIPARIWCRPLRLLRGFSPLLWVIAVGGISRSVVNVQELHLTEDSLVTCCSSSSLSHLSFGCECPDWDGRTYCKLYLTLLIIIIIFNNYER